MLESGINRNQIVNELSRSAHGKLAEYAPIINPACSQDPEFVAHLIAWDFVNGQIKDSKLALPILSLASRQYPDELVENSLAHICAQSPREVLRALRFSFQTRPSKRRQKLLLKTVRQYLIYKMQIPAKWWRLAARHRRTLHELHALSHCPMPEWASKILFCNDYTAGSIFQDIRNLKLMGADQIAATIEKWHLSPLIVSGALAGSTTQQKDSSKVLEATVNQMSATELVTQAKSLERRGISKSTTGKETFRKKVAAATKSQKATLKTSVAADELEDDGLKTMLQELQERQIQAQKEAGRGLKGNWLIIGDKSSSMEAGIEMAKHVAAAVSKFVDGRVWLVFCDEQCKPVAQQLGLGPGEVTGLQLEHLNAACKYVSADGWTSIGIGIAWATHYKLELDGIVMVTDGGENRPPFAPVAYRGYVERMHKSPALYYYKVRAGSNFGVQDTVTQNVQREGIMMTTYDLSHGQVDYYSIPNLVQGMSANAFGVVDKIMAAPLLTLEMVMPGLELRKGVGR